MGKSIVVIGGGPGGYVAAIRAAQLKNEVTLIEKDELGGTCLNRGCTPTKLLVQSANAFWKVKNSAAWGISANDLSFDYSVAVKRKHEVVKKLVGGVGMLMKKNKIKVIKGTAIVESPQDVRVYESGEKIKADAIVIASGSVPAPLSIEGVDSEGVINSNEALEMTTLPKSVLIIGAGVYGIEFAQILSRLGVKVTVVEMMPNILPTVDKEAVIVMEKLLVNEGIKIITDASVNGIKKKSGELIVFLETKNGKDEIGVDKVLIGVGRRPQIAGLGIEALGVKVEKGFISVNDRMETSVPGIYAIGDVVGKSMLAHVASAEGKCAAENASGSTTAMDYRAIPRCIYTSPEIASVGLTESDARERYGDKILIGKFPMVGNSMSAIIGETSGFVKIIAEPKYGEVLGVLIVGSHATELIAEAVLGIQMEATYDDFSRTIHAHPTVSEAIMEAALGVEGKSFHI